MISKDEIRATVVEMVKNAKLIKENVDLILQTKKLAVPPDIIRQMPQR